MLACTCMLLTASWFPQEGRHKAELERRKAAGEGAAAPPPAASDEAPSPFAAISATMGWETFHMVQMLWLGAADTPPRAPEKDWELQALPSCIHEELLFGKSLFLASLMSWVEMQPRSLSSMR